MDVDVRGASWRWSLLLSVVFLNICLPSLVLSYGVLLAHLVDNDDVPIWLGLSTPTLYILTYSLTQCWCREAADSWGGPSGFRVMAALGLVVVVASLLICVLVPYHWQPYVYGILGGFGSSLISAQVDAVVFETYDSQLGIARGLCFAGQAIGLSIFPHIITTLIEHYEYAHALIVLSGIMLQTLPAILLLKVDDTHKKPVSFSRYSDLAKSYAVYSEVISTNNAAELQLHDMSKKCWKSPSDDNVHREFDDNDSETAYTNEATATITPPPSPEEKRRNIFGVEILPEIPEESEDSDDDDYYQTSNGKNKNNKQRLSLAIKRLSTLGYNIDDCISNQSRRDSQCDRDGSESRDYSDVEVTYDNISPVTDIQREKIFSSFNFRCKSAYASMRRRIWMPSYRVYRIRRRVLYFMYNVNDTFIKPLTRSLACWRFYPSVALAFAKLSLTAITLVLLPLMASRMQPKILRTESNFLITLYAFTWMCFLLCTPWLIQTPKRNFKYISMVGLMISTAACFILAEADNHDIFSIGVVIAGFGYGAITSCWETTVQHFVGPRKWSKLHSTLETVSGSMLALFVVGISFIVENDKGLQLVMFVLGIVLFGITGLWILLLIASMIITKVRAVRLGKNWLL